MSVVVVVGGGVCVKLVSWAFKIELAIYSNDMVFFLQMNFMPTYSLSIPYYVN